MSGGFCTRGQEVYILRADRGEEIDRGDRGLFKIGRTKDYAGRLRRLQTGCPYPLLYVGGTVMGNNGACPVSVEGAALRSLAPYRTRGEWHECTWIQLLNTWRDTLNAHEAGHWPDEVPIYPWGAWLADIANDNAA